MKCRITGYVLAGAGFLWAMAFVWPGLHGLCLPFIPPQVHRVYERTAETVPRHHYQQAQHELHLLHLEKRRGLLLPLLMMLAGAVFLDVANRRRRRSQNKALEDTSP